jgi:hypothetical protein
MDVHPFREGRVFVKVALELSKQPGFQLGGLFPQLAQGPEQILLRSLLCELDPDEGLRLELGWGRRLGEPSLEGGLALGGDGVPSSSALPIIFDGGRRKAMGHDPIEEAMAHYERLRNEAAMPGYELDCQLASLEPPPLEMQRLFGALHGNEEETNRFLGTIFESVPIPEFFAPHNIERIVQAAA